MSKTRSTGFCRNTRRKKAKGTPEQRYLKYLRNSEKDKEAMKKELDGD